MATTTERIRYVFEGSTAGLDSATRRAQRDLKGLEQVAQGVGGRFGELAGRASALGRGLGALGPAAIAVAAVGAAAVGSVVGMVKLTRAAGEAVNALKPLQGTSLGLSDDQVARIDRANDSLDAMWAAGSKLAATIAANIAPSVEQLATVVVAMGLAASDAFTSFAGGTSIVTSSIDAMGRAFATFVDAEAGFLKGWRAIRQALGDTDTSGLDATIASVDALSVSLKTGLSASLGEVFSNMLDLDRARAFIQGLGGDAEGAAKKAAQLQSAMDALAKLSRDVDSDTISRWRQIALDHDDRVAALDDIRAKMIENGATAEQLAVAQQVNDAITLRMLREEADLRAKIRDEQLGAAQKTLSIVGGASNQLTSILVDNAKKQADAESSKAQQAKTAALVAFRAGQLASVAAIGVETARNTVSFAAPPPAGLGPFLGPPAALTLGATAVGAALAQKPPSFDVGGRVVGGPRMPGGNNRQVLAQLEIGEEVRTVEQQRDDARRMSPVVLPIVVSRVEAERQALSSARNGGIISRLQRRRGRGQRRFSGV